MTPVEVFSDPELAEHSQNVSCALVDTMTGEYYVVALAALFCTFVSVCRKAEMDPAREWEAMIAMLEGRKTATHDAHRALQ